MWIIGIPPKNLEDADRPVVVDKKGTLMATNQTPSMHDSYTLIFWGNLYDENVATIFASRLRAAGLCVKIVGIDGLHAKGKNGITLQADLCVSEIGNLASQTQCVVLPCDITGYQKFEKDPQIQRFFTELRGAIHVANPNLTFVVNHGLKAFQLLLKTSFQRVEILTYPQEDALFRFTYTITEKLVGHFSNSISRRHLFPTHLPGVVYP